ncbi:hypothetical protein N0V82_005196 [Gnomoniopsis sp. IMI 355080]|nr:hypothetical protein N0V82_005196 [Gnomoniopsis sp. IMI 355080]
MVDPLTGVGVTSSIIQLVQAISCGLLALRNAVRATKDVHNEIQVMLEQLEQLKSPVLAIQQYIERQPTNDESELNIVIARVTTNCLGSLETIQAKLPKVGRRHQRLAAAIKKWINERDIQQAKRHVDGYLQNLGLILPLLNLFKTDQFSTKLDTISRLFEEYRAIDRNVTTSEDDGETLEINMRIRAFANHMAIGIAMDETDTLRKRTRSSKASSSPATHLSIDDQGQVPIVKPTKSQLMPELEANRTALDRLKTFHLHEGAVELQRRAVEINMWLASDRTKWEESNKYHEMREVLADFLLQCDSKESLDEALDILKQQVRLFTVIPCELTSATPYQLDPRLTRLHLKLGKAYKETGQLEYAMRHLRTAFAACDNEDPSELEMLEDIANHLLEVYEYRVHDSDDAQRVVCVSQLRGFRTEMETALGRPPADHTPECSEALRWCENTMIMGMVQKIDQRYRFDKIDPDIASSPLHIAAEKCLHDKIVLQQIIENSDTLENRNEENETPLLVAVEKSNIDAIALLIKKRANVNARDNKQHTVLHISKKTEVTKLLLGNRLFRSDSISEYSESNEGSLNFHRASVSSSTSPPEDVVDVDAHDIHHRTPLWNACDAGKTKTVNLLLHAGADPNKSRYGKSPLAAAIDSKARRYSDDPNKRVQVVTALIHSGADPAPGKELLLRRPNIIGYKPLVRALDTSEGRSLLSPTSTGSTTLPGLDIEDSPSKFPWKV